MNVAFNMDCMEAMKEMEDNQFDLAIVDPPYGIGFGNYERTIDDRTGRGHTNKDWDDGIPKDIYFSELLRVTKNQIVWGGNYFPVLWDNACRGFIFWYKHQPVNTFADGELAWVSFDRVARCFDYLCYGNIGKDSVRLHPTQKPVKLYEWLLKNYAKKGDTILDTHLGSGSSRIAAYNLGFDFTGYELDKDYFDAQQERFRNHISQRRIFDTPKQILIQEAMNFEEK